MDGAAPTAAVAPLAATPVVATLASPWRTFAIASIAVMLVSIDATVLYAAFPALRRGFPAATAGDLSSSACRSTPGHGVRPRRTADARSGGSGG